MYWMMMAMALVLSPADAPAAATTGQPPERVRSIAVGSGQACPEAEPGEVVVCHPIEDPYRIPKSLRRSEIAARTQSWVDRTAMMDEVGRVAGGLPDTCSVVGTGGQTGCAQAAMRQWAAERRAMARDAAP